MIPTSVDTDGSIFNGVGYIDGYRLNSSGTLTAETNGRVTGHIHVNQGEIIRIGFVEGGTMSYINYLYKYDESFTRANYSPIANDRVYGALYFHAFFTGYIRFSYSSNVNYVKVQKGTIKEE